MKQVRVVQLLKPYVYNVEDAVDSVKLDEDDAEDDEEDGDDDAGTVCDDTGET